MELTTYPVDGVTCTKGMLAYIIGALVFCFSPYPHCIPLSIALLLRFSVKQRGLTETVSVERFCSKSPFIWFCTAYAYTYKYVCVGYIALVGTVDINFCHIVDKDVCLTLKTFQITYHIEVGSWEVMCLFCIR